MTLPVRLTLLATGLVLFAVLHSLLAATSVRARLERAIGARRYRLAYNLVAVVTLVLPFLAARGPTPTIWDPTGAGAWALLAVQGAAVVVFVMALRRIDLGHLVGLQQLRGHLVERRGLQTSGVYALCRHPLYFSAAVAASATPHMDARGLIVALWLWTYAYIGARIEERKLHQQFGAAYRHYCDTTPRLLPWPGARRRGDIPGPASPQR